MDLRPDPMQTQLRRALRAGLAGVAVKPGLRGVPVDDGPASQTAAVLAELSAPMYELPVAHGGLGLGLAAGVTVSEELGRAACGNPYRAAALVSDAAMACGRADVLDNVRGGMTVSVAGLEDDPGGGVTAAPGEDGGVELTGTVLADAAGADLLAVGFDRDGSQVLALVAAGSSGYKWHGDAWPAAVQLSGVPVTDRDIMPANTGLGLGPLPAAQVRQAGYLVGLAAGMHAAAVKYTGSRHQFGGRLRDHQAIGFPLARMTVSLRATRLAVHHAAWMVDSGRASMAPVEALAAAADTLLAMVPITMQVCGSRCMTSELSLHRYYRLAAAEPFRYGKPGKLWRRAGAARLVEAGSGFTRPS
jgi:alkylation response protein AidB-like acyl-CoA dehydrogenase